MVQGAHPGTRAIISGNWSFTKAATSHLAVGALKLKIYRRASLKKPNPSLFPSWGNPLDGFDAVPPTKGARHRDLPMTFSRPFRWKLIAGLLAAITFDTMLQLIWKTAVLETPAETTPLDTLSSVFANPLTIGIISIMTLQFFNWLMVLGEADLSYAKPIASLSYVSVPLLSAIVLHEAVDIVEIVGVVCVVAGVWFISQTKPLTQPKET
jgi:multidrug transporter EmrE-like cation transporter